MKNITAGSATYKMLMPSNKRSWNMLRMLLLCGALVYGQLFPGEILSLMKLNRQAMSKNAAVKTNLLS